MDENIAVDKNIKIVILYSVQHTITDDQLDVHKKELVNQIHNQAKNDSLPETLKYEGTVVLLKDVPYIQEP